MKKIQGFTEEQSKQIDELARKRYKNALRTMSLLELLRAYHVDLNNEAIDPLYLEETVSVIIDEFAPINTLFCEMINRPDYILSDHAIEN